MTGYSAQTLHYTMMTPFDPKTGAVAEEEFGEMVTKLVKAGSSRSVTPIVNAEAGEIYTLTPAEIQRNVEIGVAAAGGSPVVAGVVGRTSAEAIECAQISLAAGASALFVLPPYGSADITISWDAGRYPEVVVDYLKAIAKAVGPVPLLIHPTATRSPAYGIGWPTETVKAVIAAVPSVAGWKMTYSYEGFRKVSRYLKSEAPQVAVLPSSAVRFHENLANGVLDGACSGSFGYAMEPMLEHIRLWDEGDVVAATALWNGGLAELHEYVYDDYSRLHIRYKLAAWINGAISSPYMRDPMPAPSMAEARRLLELMQTAGIAARNEADLAPGLGL